MNLAFGYQLGKHKHGSIALEEGDRLRSEYVIGSSGSGKSSLLETQIVQDCSKGFAVFDVEDRLTERTLRHLCDAGRDPLVIDPTITDPVVPMNVLSVPPGIHPHTVIEGVLQAFRRGWPDAWGARLEDLLRHSLLLLMEHNLTLGELPQLLSDQTFRERAADASQDQRVRLYFQEHMGELSKYRLREWVESTRNKVGALMSNPFIASPLSAQTSVDFLEFMDAGTPIVVNLPESILGDSGRLFGMLLISRFFQASLRRSVGAAPFIIYCDEFQTLATRAFLDLVTRGRKRGIGAVVAHQSVSQPPFDSSPEYVTTMLSNTAVHVVMQVGREDAERFAKELFPATGTQAKRRKRHWLWGDHGDPQFYSVQEEREQQCSMIEEQRPRECFIKVRRATGFTVYCAEAFEVPEPSATAADAAALSHASLAKYGVPLSDVLAAQAERLARFKPSRKRKAVDNQPPSQET